MNTPDGRNGIISMLGMGFLWREMFGLSDSSWLEAWADHTSRSGALTGAEARSETIWHNNIMRF
jgi:hypothetical protein